MHLIDGNEAVRGDLPAVIDLIVKTVRWVHPDAFRVLPVWYPEIARGQWLYQPNFIDRQTNTKRATGLTEEKREGNVLAARALKAALDIQSPQPKNWTVCHIWGFDDPSYGGGGSIVHDPRYYSCTANMVLLPTSLKGFTDSIPEIKDMLRICSFHLYGFDCHHTIAGSGMERIRSGWVPDHYPSSWPRDGNMNLPPGTSTLSQRVERRASKRKEQIRALLVDSSLVNFPRDQVRQVLDYWGIKL